jgi:hypothetical protein
VPLPLSQCPTHTLIQPLLFCCCNHPHRDKEAAQKLASLASTNTQLALAAQQAQAAAAKLELRAERLAREAAAARAASSAGAAAAAQLEALGAEVAALKGEVRLSVC